ncbi:MAG: sigma-70 family RNA polymerase sigma factor [Planctomycetes bacterium]|nr:sigma-70 family RNA polymerase sigma factor [Planctomycetota bacterium]
MTAAAHRFPSTCWTVIRDAQQGGVGVRAAALERLLSTYWRPVYWTLRLDWSESPESARDHAQSYFASFLERDLLQDVAAERGRFRSYVKTTLKHWMLNQRRDQAAVKRGGGVRIVALDDLDPVEADPPARDLSPEQRFERELMRAIVDQAMTELRAELEAAGHGDRFTLFARFHGFDEADHDASYQALTREFGLGAHDVKNQLARTRARFRDLVLAHLRDGLSSEADLVAEIRAVFG